MINKKVISLVLSLALIVSCFASLASLGVYAVDNTKKTTSLQTAPVVTTTTAEKKMADAEEGVESSIVATTPRTIVNAYPSEYPEWHCECGNVWADPSHNGDTTEPTSDLHYLWGSADKCKNEDGLGCDGTLHKWTAISANFGGKTNGYFYLTKDVNLTAQCSVANGNVLAFDLNGKTLTQTGAKRMATFRGKTGVSLALTDTSSDSSGTYIPKIAADQGVICWVNANGGSNQHVRIYGGNYNYNSLTNLTSYAQYGLISAMDTASSTLSIYEGSKFDASGLTSGSASHGGALIKTTGSSSKVNIYGAELIGPGSFNVRGGTIDMENNTAELTIVDSVISGGHSSGLGGNIYIGNAKTTLTNSRIINGSSTTTAGNIFVDKATVNINNCDIYGGTSGGNGGNIAIGGAATVTINNSSIYDGSSTSTASGAGGGNFRFGGGNTTITGCTIADGTSAKYGGNISASGGTVTINDSTITGGTSSSSGASIHIAGGTVNLNDNTISHSSSNKAIVYNNGTNTSIDGGEITSNVLAVYNADEKTITIDNADITSNTGIAFQNLGTATVTNSNFTSSTSQALQNSSVANITGGTFTSGTYTIANNSSNSQLTMTGSTITSSGSRGINNGTSSCDTATATLNNCTVTGALEGVTNGGSIMNYAVLTINGGTIGNADATAQSGTAIYNTSPSEDKKTEGGKLYINGNANIIGGTATSHGGTLYNTGGAYLEINEGVTISGGTTATNGGNIYNNATLVMNGATVTGGQAGTTGTSSSGGNIYNTATGTSTITGCTISDGKSTDNGGNVFVGGDMNFVNCTITGGETTTTSGKGGNIVVSSANTTANLTDCTISNGSAKDNGGAMYVSNSATTTIVNINGCTFTGNKVFGGSKFGGDMFIGAAIVNIGASETKQTTFTDATSEYESKTTGYTISDNSIATNSTAAHVTIKDATEVSNILPRQTGEEGIIIQDTATVKKVYVEAAEFTVNETTYDYVDKLLLDFTDNSATQTVDIYPWRASNIRIDRTDFAKAPSNVTFNLLATDYRLENDGTFYDLIYVTQTRTQCVCGGKAADVGDHVCDNTVVFTEWYDPESLPTSGNYYLTNNVNMATTTTTGDLNLDLNGFDIKKTEAVVLFEVPVGKTFNLTDTEGTGSIDGDKIATASDGANILVKGTFNMFAGTIKDGYADGEKGGNINAKNNAVINMYGGTIKDGNANKGGNICTDYNTNGTHGVLNMYAGSITGGTAAAIGGNLFMYDTSVAYINGTVTGGTAPEKFGPDIYVSYRNDKIGNARAGAQLTLGADAVVGTVDAMYPYTTVTVEDGAQVTTLNYNTFNAKRTAIANTAPTAEKIADTDNADSAFNNWYLLARGQKKTDGSNWIRFTSLVDSEIDSYYAAGYFITVEGEETADMETHDVYKTNYESGVEKQIGDYSLDSDYYFHVDLEFSQDDIDAGKTITIKPYLCDNEGNYYYGAEKTVSLAALFPPAGE